MPRFVLYLSYLPALWVTVTNVSLAQKPAGLRVQTERLHKNRQAEQQALERNDTIQLAEAYYQYGRTYVFAGDYRTSQGYFLKALRMLEPGGDSENLSRIYVRLGENESRLGRHDDAVRYARLALTVARRTGSLMALGRAYGVMAHLYEDRWVAHSANDRAMYDSVRYYYGQKQSAFQTLNDTLGMAETSLELGTLLTKVNDPRAIPHLTDALRMVSILHRDRMKVNVLLHLASAYLTFGKPRLAFQTLRAAETLYARNQVDEYDTILGLEKEYVLYYQTMGQWKKAFAHQKRVNRLVNGQLSSDREATIARLNVEYETEKKEALLRAQQGQLALRTQNLRTQQRFTVVSSTLFVVAAGMSLVFFRLYRKNKRISRRNEELVKEQNHRVKNNLQVVSSLLSLQANRLSDEVARQAVEESRLRVQSMAILHRRLYDGDRLAAVNLDEFIREVVAGVLRAYGFSAVQTRFAIDDISLSADKAVPLGLIINELVTNACKYAFPDNVRPQLRIDCHRQHHTLHLRVADNGPGLAGPDRADANQTTARLGGFGETTIVRESTDQLYAEPYRSFGMQLIQAQVEQLYGTYRFSSDAGSVFTLECNV